MAANIFLLFVWYHFLNFYCYFTIDNSVGHHLCFESGTKSNITRQKTISRDISFIFPPVIALIKAQVCENMKYTQYLDYLIWVYALALLS